MKKNYLFWVAFTATTICFSQTIFINEIHYDNIGGDVAEGVEICGTAGIDLAGYEVYLYNGSGSTYLPTKITLSGIIPSQQNDRGTLWFAQEGIQNGSPDGLALVDNLGAVIQFLSYEGVITATDGPAIGMTSVDIGVSESNATTLVGYSLQLIGSGSDYTDFSWSVPIVATPGLPNISQTLPVVKNQIDGFAVYPNPVAEGKISIKSNTRADKHVEIYSIVGNRVYEKTVKDNETIYISNLTEGIYFMRVEEESKIATRKLVIK